MSALIEDMQLTTSVMDIFQALLKSLEAMGNATSVIAHNTGSEIDKFFLEKQIKEEARVLKDFISHMEKGREVKAVEVLDHDQANLMTQILKSEGVPFIANTTEKGMLFMYKDIDVERFMSIAKEAERYVADKGHEMNHPEFMEKIGTKQEYVKVEGLTEEEVAVFRREADKQTDPFIFAVTKDSKGTYEICANKKDVLERTINDTLFVMGTAQGQKYAKELTPFEKSRDVFLEKAKEMSRGNTPAYIIDAKNPTHIIELSRDTFRTHGVGVDKEGKVVDIAARYAKPISHDIYSEIKTLKMEKPILVSPYEATSFINGLTREGTIQFAAKYTGSPEKFIGLSQMLEDKFVGKSLEPPIHEPKLEVVSMAQDFKIKARDMTVYHNIPLPTLLKIEKANIDGVYTYNKGNTREVACTPEAADAVAKIMKESLAKDKGSLDTWLTMEKYKGHGERGENKDDVYYIVDASFPDAVLEISPQDLTYSDTEVVQKLEIPDGSSRDDVALAQIFQMGAPIVLSKDEYDLMIEEGFEGKQQIIESHFMNPMSSNVVKAEQEKLENEREKLENLIYSPDSQKLLKKDITPAQQYVLKQHEKRNLKAKELGKLEVKELDIDKGTQTREAKDIELDR